MVKNYDEKQTNESARFEIAGHNTPNLSISFSSAFSLYQYLIFLSQKSPESADYPTNEKWRHAASRVAGLYSTLGALNFFEISIVGAETVDELGDNLRARAAFFADEMFNAVEGVKDLYRETIWPEHRSLLSDALEEIKELLTPHYDELLLLQSERLGLKKQPDSYQVSLVPITYQLTGAYSHPIVISVTKFRGLQLVEALIHELTHVIADLNKSDPQSAYQLIRKYTSLKQRPEREALQLFHLLLFLASGNLVREVFSDKYVPYAETKNIHGRLEALMGKKLNAGKLSTIWSAWIDHNCDLETAMKNLVEAVSDH